VPLRPPQIPHGLIWAWTWSSVVRGQQLNADAMAWPINFKIEVSIYMSVHRTKFEHSSTEYRRTVQMVVVPFIPCNNAVTALPIFHFLWLIFYRKVWGSSNHQNIHCTTWGIPDWRTHKNKRSCVFNCRKLWYCCWFILKWWDAYYVILHNIHTTLIAGYMPKYY
jgi:hypothetical protein